MRFPSSVRPVSLLLAVSSLASCVKNAGYKAKADASMRDLSEALRQAPEVRDASYQQDADHTTITFLRYGSDFGQAAKAIAKIVAELGIFTTSRERRTAVEQAVANTTAFQQPEFAKNLETIFRTYLPAHVGPIVSVTLSPDLQQLASSQLETITTMLESLRTNTFVAGDDLKFAFRNYAATLIQDVNEPKFDSLTEYQHQFKTLATQIVSGMDSFLEVKTAIRAPLREQDLAAISDVLKGLSYVRSLYLQNAVMGPDAALTAAAVIQFKISAATLATVSQQEALPHEMTQLLDRPLRNIGSSVIILKVVNERDMRLSNTDLNLSIFKLDRQTGRSQVVQYSIVLGTNGKEDWIGLRSGEIDATHDVTIPVAELDNLRQWAISPAAQGGAEATQKRSLFGKLGSWVGCVFDGKGKTCAAEDTKTLKVVQLIGDIKRLVGNSPKHNVLFDYLAKVGNLPEATVAKAGMGAFPADYKSMEPERVDIDGKIWAPGVSLPELVVTSEQIPAEATANSESSDDSAAQPRDKTAAQDQTTRYVQPRIGGR